MNSITKKYVLVIGSKPFSKLPRIQVEKIYCANGAAERCHEYEKIFNKTAITSVVSESEFNKREDVRERVLKINPDIIFCRYGKINEKFFNNENKIKKNIINLSKSNQFFWQSKFYNFGILTLLISEFNYEELFIKKIKHIYDCLRWRGFLCSSTGLFSILLAYFENPDAEIIVSGIGIKSGGETFYGTNKNRTFRSNVDKKLFFKLKKKIKDKLITTDEEMSHFCKVPLWKHEII